LVIFGGFINFIYVTGRYLNIFISIIFMIYEIQNILEDLDFAIRTELSYQRFLKGEFVTLEFDKFVEMMEKL
jgi:hypothetical protein